MRAVYSAVWAGVFGLVLCPAVTAADDDKALAAKARDILKANCYRCHGLDGAVEGGMNYVLDAKTLVSRKKVEPGAPAKSKLFKRLTSEDNPMPPEDEKVRPSKDDVAVIKKWIEAGAPGVEAAEAPREVITEADVIKHVADDLEKTDESDRRFVRYFTLCHLYNLGLSDDEIQTYRNGVSKLANSLSWGREIAVPKPIDARKTILRIDLRDYKWSAAMWQRLTAAYLYANLLPDATAMAVYAAVDWDLPYLRGDWFVFNMSRPPYYHLMLQLPYTAAELEKELKVDVASNIEARQVVRCGFNGSGISRQNRLIERHDTPYGAYWKSYDFAGSADKKNLFAYPFGPGDGPHDFEHDGGEIIFNLPNGLQGYMLVDGHGRRINEGPTKIVSDPRQPDKAVVNGISCMSCHSKGLIEKDDQIREHVAKNRAGFNDREAEAVRALYPPRDKFLSAVRADQARFKTAVEKTGARVTTTDPIVAVAMRYDQEMDLKSCASESGLTAEEFARRLRQSAGLSRTLGALNVDGGTIDRRVFAQQLHAIIRDMRLGIPRSIINSAGMILNYIPAGEFQMGSADNDDQGRANERPLHRVRITRAFYMGNTTVTQEQFQRVYGKNPSWFGPERSGGATDYPVDSVTWTEANNFCRALTEMEEEKRAGRRYRLPTEAEWEYACRAGTKTRFFFGDQLLPTQANIAATRAGRPVRGGVFPPNRFGLYDMHGNMWQMCSDWYDADYYARSPVNDPQGPPATVEQIHIMRGGTFGDDPFWARSAARSANKPEDRQRMTGFRVVCVQD